MKAWRFGYSWLVFYLDICAIASCRSLRYPILVWIIIIVIILLDQSTELMDVISSPCPFGIGSFEL